MNDTDTFAAGVNLAALVSISCPATSAPLLRQAHALAERTGIGFCPTEQDGARFLLRVTESRVELAVNPHHRDTPAFSPIFVDLLGGSAGYRHMHSSSAKQPLARAVGIRAGFRPVVLDATAGLGGDGFVLACLGCRVYLAERSPVVAALLEDGLRRAREDLRTADIANNMHLLAGDSRQVMARLPEEVYTIYLDPMYPHTSKSALNKKEMRILREIVGADEDGPELLGAALVRATNRVVVKRPKGAEYLGHRRPSHEIQMKNSRFDVYLTHHL